MNFKKMLFCREYLKDYNATGSAKRAGYAESSAGQMGHALLKDPGVLEYIEKAMVKRMQRLEIDADWVLDESVRLYKTDVSKFIKVGPDGDPIIDFSKCTAEELAIIDDLQIEETYPGGERKVKTKIKLTSKIKLLEIIGKHIDVQSFKEKLEVEGQVTLNFDEQDKNAG